MTDAIDELSQVLSDPAEVLSDPAAMLFGLEPSSPSFGWSGLVRRR